METLVERFRLEDVQKSPAFFDVKKLSHFNGVYIRALSVSEFVEAARPWLDPAPGEWAPGRWLDPDTNTPVVAPVPWSADRYDPARFDEVAAVAQERVAVLSEVPALVDFLFEEDAPIDDASWEKAIAGDEAAPAILAGGAGGLRRERVGQGHAARGDAGHRGGRRPQAGQGAGADPGGGHGAHPGAAALRLAGGARARRDVPPDRGGAGPAGARRLMLFGPLRWAIRIVLLLAAAIFLYFAVTFVQVWLTSRQYDPHPAGAIVVMGAAQYNCVPSPDLQARLDQALTLYHQGYSHLIMVTGNKEPGDKCTEAESGAQYLESKGVPARRHPRGGRRHHLREHRRRRAGSGATRVPASCWSRPTPSTRTAPWRSHRRCRLSPSPTPTQTSPITGWATVPYFFKEAVGVGLGRIIGFNHLEWLHDA